MTRGKQRNNAYVIEPDPHAVEPHLDQPEDKTLTGLLAEVLARSDADLSATETLSLEVDRHASLSTLLGEYDLLAREAQAERWVTFLDVAPFPENVADEVFTSPYYEHLEAALARHEAAGHIPTIALSQLTPRLAPGDEQHDPAAQLAGMLDQATSQLRPGRNARSNRVAGLIATPAEPITEDMRTALDDRQTLIEAAAHRLAEEALDTGAAWTKRLGTPPSQPRARAQWQAHAATIALYRSRYGLNGASPIGDAKTVKTAEQAAQYRVAQSAIAQALRVSSGARDDVPRHRAAVPRSSPLL